MAAVLNLDMDCVSRLEQYEDDSVEAWFTDGTSICLTACGSAFTRQEKFTAYASKECRERVCTLLAFRNLFAEQPFLPATLFTNEIKVSENAIDYGVWPSNQQQAVGCNLFKTGLAGEIRFQSSDGCAWVELASHGQTLTVCYLARLSCGDRVGLSGVMETEVLENGLTTPETSREQGSEKTRHQYVWRREIHSTAKTPRAWAHPLSLLMQHRSHDTHMTTTTPDKENERQDAVVSTALPSTLPLSCLHPHLHHTQQQTLRVKVLFTEGVLYRAFFDHQQPFVEALPNQMTVLRSYDPDGRFFHCWSVDDDGSRCVQESMYCVDHTPLASGLHPFSIAGVIGQASRLLDRVRKVGASNVKLCWKAPSPLPSPPSSPLHYTVPGLGRFTVRTNGHVRCVFIDRTIVDFFNTSKTDLNRENETPDLTSRGSGLNFSCPPGFDRGRGVEVARGVWVDQNWCRLFQPNGRYLILSTHHPTSHHRSVEMWFFRCR
ncbi:Uncharacterized protein C5orf34 homolog [Geodia barretti]|uniref:Uncharacterized protein C5orf34 homolog n=1 Tax=Geodia barretti TaxID=519541 RepID=A0AA35RH80_GEOBA|nr:Uncharacterized protein C5orf34 homolog [Geodia barretti]